MKFFFQTQWSKLIRAPWICWLRLIYLSGVAPLSVVFLLCGFRISWFVLYCFLLHKLDKHCKRKGLSNLSSIVQKGTITILYFEPSQRKHLTIIPINAILLINFFRLSTLVSLEMSKNRAVPLCLPNNCKWDEKSGVYSKDEDKSRTSLCVIDAALRKLRQIKGYDSRIN